MPLPALWVDHLFAKLSVRYGAAFMRQWPDTDPALVKADWAEVLDGTRGESISYALSYLPSTPPNALQFRNLCRSSPREDLVAIEPPTAKPDPARVKAILAGCKAQARPADAEQCARNILRIVADRGGRMSVAQRAQIQAMKSQLQPDTLAAAVKYATSLEAAE